ncbi:uL30 family ribosomal protein, partial [Ralstonia pseudosolanacearum]|uniref:uL30 family ribosomal protein n=1 Tax=Ralstonia pseudosolanacearum TaxID=1310165 RepID=UPI003D17E79D
VEDAEGKPLAYIPEIVLKKRKSNEEWAIKRRERFEQRKLKSKQDKKYVFKRPEQFIKDYRTKELDLIHMKQRRKLRKSSKDTPKSQLLFIIRIPSTSNAMHPKARKILHRLRLGKMFTGVFVKVNDGLIDMLRMVEPYVTYGYPNLKSVKELVYKKGYGNIDKQCVPLTDNNIIEQELGKFGILCIEDIVHEIASVGSHFKDVAHFLWPIKLNRPEGSLQGQKKPFKDGGDSGNREELINELINTMN